MGAELLRKYVSSSMIICYRSVVRHPFLVGMIIVLFSMYRLFPLLFSLLVSASPVIVSTAVLLGTLLSYGQPNIPEIETEVKSDIDETRKLESKVARDGSFASEEVIGSKIEISNRSFDDNCCVEGDDTPANLVEFGEEQLVEEAKSEMEEEKVVLGSHYSPLQQTEDEHIVLENDDKLWEGSPDPLNSNSGLLWKRVERDDDDDDDDNGDDDDEDDDDEGSDSGSDSGSDLAESSSPDASMADIIPMLDELHPLLSEEQETHEVPPHHISRGGIDAVIPMLDELHPLLSEERDTHEVPPHHMSRGGIDAVSEHSLESSDTTSESHDDDDEDDKGDVENREDLEAGNDDEDDDKESKHTDKEDETRSAILWTEYDQKNLMNLGTSEMERNRRLENLIARRRARKTMRMQAEKNLIDLETSDDLPWNIPPISTARINPFDYDSNDNIPGSAPSVLLQRRNPFDLPYDSSEEKPDLVGDTFQQEFAVIQPKEPFFRRHESFNIGPSSFGASRSERQETRMKPYFVPERSFAEFQRQFSGLSDSRISSVPDTESVSSVGDLENKDHVEDEKDQEHVSDSDHVRPYFVPETQFSTFQRQFSGLSDSKVSSVPDTGSVSSDSDLENKDCIEDNDSIQAEQGSIIRDHSDLVSESEQPLIEIEHESDHQIPYFVPEHVVSNETSFSSFERQLSEVSDSKVSSVPDSESVSSDDDREIQDQIDVSREQEQELMSVEDYVHGSDVIEHESEQISQENDVNMESVEIDDAEISVGIHLNLGDEELHQSGPTLSSSDEASDPIYNGKIDEDDDDEVATSVPETTYFVDNSTERSEIGVTSLLVEESQSQPNEPIYDLSPRSVTRNLSSSSISNDLHKDESFQASSSVTETRDSENQVLNVPNTPILETNDVLLEMDATRQLENVQILSDEIPHEGVHHEEVISQSNEESLLDRSMDEPLTEDPEGCECEGESISEVVQKETPQEFVSEGEALSQASDENPQVEINLQTEEPEKNILPNMDPVSSDENIDDVDEIDENLLVELDAVGDFSVKDLGSTFDDMELVDHHHLGTKLSSDQDSDLVNEMNQASDNDLETTKNSQDEDIIIEMKQDQDTTNLDLATKLSGDEDSYSKDLGSNSYSLDHDLETKLSGDENSYSDNLESNLNEMKQAQDTSDLDLDLVTKGSGEKDSSSNDLGTILEDNFETKDLNSTFIEMRRDPDHHHRLETFYSVDENFYSKHAESDLNEMKHDLVTNRSGDEISNKEIEVAVASEASLTKLVGDADEIVLPQETKSTASLTNSNDATMVDHGTENASTASNTDKE